MNTYKKITYDCKKATFLIEKQELAGLSVVEIVMLKIHLAGCSLCRLYQKQSLLISQQFAHSKKRSHVLPDEVKQKLQETIDTRIAEN